MLPAAIRAVTIRAPGGPEVLEMATLPCPRPGPGQVLIAVAAAGVNRPDISQRVGTYPVPADASPIPGLEVAGHVLAIGAGVAGVAPGDAVCALVHGGGYASHALAEAGQVLPVPAGLSLSEAAALPEVAFTVEYNLMMRAGLSSGETVLIHGGSSGIGAHAIQRARAAGARVIVTAGSVEKCDWCRRIGADLAINYRKQDFVAEALAVTGGRGVDVVLDMVGGGYADRNLKALAEDGRCALISLQGGRRVEMDLEPMLRRRLTMVGATLRPLPPARKAAIALRLRQEVWPLVAAGAIRPHIHATFPLGAAAEAHREMERGTHRGKIVLTLD